MCIGWVCSGAKRVPHYTSIDCAALLEMVEPLEETRSELIFATEPLLSSLYLSIPNSNHRSPIVELDEVEVSIISSAQRSSDIDGRKLFFRSRRVSSNSAKGSPSFTPPRV